MTVGITHLVDLSRKILSTDSGEREEAAENVSDWAQLFERREADLIVRLLATIASVEPEPRNREAQLHAILEIESYIEIDRVGLYPLARLDPKDLDSQQMEYLRDLGIV